MKAIRRRTEKGDQFFKITDYDIAMELKAGTARPIPEAPTLYEEVPVSEQRSKPPEGPVVTQSLPIDDKAMVSERMAAREGAQARREALARKIAEESEDADAPSQTYETRDMQAKVPVKRRPGRPRKAKTTTEKSL